MTSRNVAKMEAVEPPEADPDSPEAALEPHVAFRHPFFRMFPDVYFRMSEHTGKPVLVLVQPDHELVLSFSGFAREFQLEDGSHDLVMLERIAEALTYVRGLRLGDEFPSELLTGEASWEPTDQHRMLAYNRLTLQLVTWLDGEEIVYGDAQQLARLAADPDNAERLRLAVREAAEKLGLMSDHDVVGRIDRLASELAYTEALRSIYHEIVALGEECAEILRMHTREISIADLAFPVVRLMDKAIQEFGAVFRRIDQQTAQILTSLREVDEHCAFLGRERNDLYRRLRVWEDMFKLWSPVDDADLDSVAELLRGTYRFLAPRYMETHEWILATRPTPRDTTKRPKRTVRGRSNRQYGRSLRW